MNYILKSRALPCAFVLATCLAPASVFPGGAFAAPALSLRELLARHDRATRTPMARAETGAHRIAYAVAAGGLAGTMTTWEASGHRSRTELALGPLAVTTGSDGRRRWEQDGAGNVRILGGEELSEDAADAGFSLEDFDPTGKSKGKAGAAVTLRPGLDKELGCYVLDVRPRGGTSQTVYLDPKTYLTRRIVQRKGGVSGSITILSYQRRFGAQVPSHLLIGYAGLPLSIDATLTSAALLPSAPAALFLPPAAPRDWKFVAPGVTEAAIPFSAAGGEVIVPVSVNGRPLHLLLDSGAGSAFVSAQAAQSAGLTSEGDLPALGYGGTSQTGLVRDAALTLGGGAGGVSLSRQVLHVIKDPAVTAQLASLGADGAVGYEIFSRFTVQIDYAAKVVTLSDPNARRSQARQAETSVLPLKLELRTPTVLASVDGRAPARFLVDTGDAGSVHLYTRYARANGLLPRADDPLARRQQGYGVGGALQETVTPGHLLTLGTATVKALPVATMTGGGISGLSSHAGGLGNLVLSHFLVTFDYAHGRLILAPPGPKIYSRRLFPHRRLAPEVRQAASRPALTLAELLAHHLESLGGRRAVEAVTNTRVTARVSTGGIDGTITTVFAAPDREFEEDHLGILHITQGYDGATAWQRDTNGNVRPLAGEELRDLRVQLFFDTNSYVLPGRIKGTLTLRPAPEPGTGDWVVDALPEGGKPTTLYFDPKTWFIVREQHLDDNVPVTTAYGDYRTVDGVRFPFYTKTTNGTARYDITGRVLKVENNVALPAGLFSPPKDDAAKFGFVAPGRTSASVPFDTDDGEIAFSARINGRPVRVFLDTGASGIAISRRVANGLGLKSSGVLEARGYGGSADLHPILIHRFEVPNAVQLSDIAAIALDLPASLDSYFTRPAAGFVGYDLLAHFVVRIDFGRKTLTFLRPDAFRPAPKDGRAVPIELDNNVPSLSATLDGLPPQRFLIDTGDESDLRLYGPFVAKYKLDRKYPDGEVTTGGGIGGVSRARQTRVGSFSVAGETLRGVPTDFSLDPKGGASQVLAGSLGSGLLSRFVLTLDYPHGRAFFAPTSDTNAPFETRTTGISLVLVGGGRRLLVADVRPGSPAARAGLSAGDEVLAIDGRAAPGLTDARRLLSPSSGRATHTLRVRSTFGDPRTVTAALYDPLAAHAAGG